MRRAKRITLLAIGLSVLALLALGALPQYLGGGEVYYMTATEVDEDGDRPAVDASEINAQQHPYTSEALETGRSEPYEDDRFGIKKPFTHTPFDELEAVEQVDEAAVDGDAAYVERNGTLYRVELTEEP